MAGGPPGTGPLAHSDIAVRAARGAMVTMLGQGLKIVTQVLSVVILARLLSPYAYGLLAMIMAVVGVADIFRDLGLSAAAVQAPELSRAQRDNLFWLNTVFGLALAIIIFFAAPLLPVFYHQPELTAMTRVIALSFLLSGMSTQYRADLTRRMAFRQLTLVDVIAPSAALLVAIVLALLGAGYWALVVQQVTMFGVTLVLMVVFAGWLPGRWARNTQMRGFLTFGWHLAGGQIIHYLGSNVDSLVIGLRFGPGPLGLYNRGFQLLMTPLGQLRSPLTTVALPVLSRLQQQRDRFMEYVRLGQLTMGYTLVAGLGLVLGAVHPVIQILLGPQWLRMVVIMRCLAVSGMFETLAFVLYWVYVSRGLVRSLLFFTIFSTVSRAVCVVVGSHWGVNGVAVGFAVSEVLSWPVSFAWLRRAAELRVRGLIINGLRVLLVTGIIAAASWAAILPLVEFNAWLQLAAAIIGAGLVVAVMYLAVRPIRRDIQTVAKSIRVGLTRRGQTRLSTDHV